MSRVVARNDLTVELVKSMIHYDAETGVFTWFKRAGHLAAKGGRAGTRSGDGYTVIKFLGTYYPAARLAFFYMTGRWPNPVVDHINCNKSDDRFCNLREATVSQNNANVGPRAKNTSGFKGVFLHRQTGRYRAQIKVRGTIRHIGMYPTPAEASVAYQSAARQFFGDFGRSE